MKAGLENGKFHLFSTRNTFLTFLRSRNTYVEEIAYWDRRAPRSQTTNKARTTKVGQEELLHVDPEAFQKFGGSSKTHGWSTSKLSEHPSKIY